MHLPRSGGNMRLGTLAEYRRNENEAVRDEHEGTFRVTLDFPSPTSIEIDGLMRATLNTSPLGLGINSNNIRANSFAFFNTAGCVFSTDEVDIMERSEKKITLSGRVNLHAEGADAYVLCLSTSEVVGSIILDPKYDSIWLIRSGRVLDFSKQLAAHLGTLVSDGKNFSRETVGPFNAPGFSPPIPGEHMVFDVSAEIWQVSYQDRIIKISTNITEEIVQDVYGCLDRSASIKPENFAHEMEVRIIFRPIVIDKRDGQRYLFPNYLEPVFVPFEPFLNFLDVAFDATAS